MVENEAQLATALGHEIAHSTEEHALEHFSRSQSGERCNGIIGVATGGALGGILGGKKGEASETVAAANAGASIGLGIASVANAVVRACPRTLGSRGLERAIRDEILEECCESSRGQAKPRRIKRKMSKSKLRYRGPLSRQTHD